MKRRSLTFFIAFIFLIWNVLTYLFVARAPGSRSTLEPVLGNFWNFSYHVPISTTHNDSLYDDDVQDRLDLIEVQLRDQVASHEDLLRQLSNIQLDFKEQIVNTLGEKVNADNSRENVAGDSPLLFDPVESQDEEIVDPNLVVLPVLVIACNRVSVRRNLDQLIKYRPSAERFPIIVSQDCGHKETADTIRAYKDVTLVQHPDLSDITLPQKEKKFQGYYKISRHYKWALQQIFHKFNHKAVIIVEDDLDISPDFFEYFAATYPILHADDSLWCVSAWNDNGKASMVAEEPELLYRTDFFPGLGWMLEKKLFLELEEKWPKTFWDDWMRHPDQRKERSCIRPEVSRTTTFGKVGVSKGQFYEKHLKFIKLNDQPVPFSQRDLSYLLKENYDEQFVKTVYSAPLLTIAAVKKRGGTEPDKAVRVQYSDKQSFKTHAKELGIMDDLKSGVPRAGYRGVVSFIYNGRRVFYAPPASWNGYDVTWN